MSRFGANELADLNLGDGLLQFASNKQRLFGAEIKQVWRKVRINIQTANLLLVRVQNNHSKRQKGEGELWLWSIEADGRTITVKSRKERVSYGYGGLKLIIDCTYGGS